MKTLETCKRGYIASWSIRDNQLILTDIDGDYHASGLLVNKKLTKITLKKIFSKAGKQGVIANWFSGKLRTPAESMTQYEHRDYNSRFHHHGRKRKSTQDGNTGLHPTMFSCQHGENFIEANQLTQIFFYSLQVFALVISATLK